MSAHRSLLAVTTAAAFLLAATAANALTNGDFEGSYTNGVANGWTIFNNGTSVYPSEGTDRVHGGSSAQKLDISAPVLDGNAGIFQTITTTPGTLYQLDLWLWTWVNGSEGYDEALMETFVGFDSLGRDEYDHQAFVSGADWNVGWIRVSIPRNVRSSWVNFQREFLATSTSTTIFIRGVRKGGSGGCSMYIDDVSVSTVSQSGYSAAGIVPVATAPTTSGSNLLNNADFESGFTSGVANNWTDWATTGSATYSEPNVASKIGGGHYNGSAYMEDLSTTSTVAFAMPPGLAMLTTVKSNDPDILTCGRVYIDEINFWDASDADTITMGRTHANNSYAESLNYSGIDCWQGYNEPWVETLERARKVALFDLAFTERCHELGIRSLVLNLAVGTPNDNNTPLWEDLFAIADFIGYHAYGGPTYGVQVSTNENLYALRWRAVADYYETNNLRMPAVVYTEGGTYGPWKNDWSKSEIKVEYAAFGPKMMADEWNVGETIFTVGCFGFWCGWDISDAEIINYLKAWNVANPAHARTGTSQRIGIDGSAAFKGGLVQAVGTVADGEYWLTGWVKYMTGNGGDVNDPDMSIKIGYDPTGQTTNGNATSIEWSSDLIVSRNLTSHIWHDFGVSVEATGSQTSIWIALDQSAAGTSGTLFIDNLDMRTSYGTVPPTNSAPTADASAVPVSGDAPLAVSFDGTGSTDPDDDTLTYSWNFDDGSANSTSSAPSHTFTAAGSYDVVLTVNDGNGGTDTDSVTITVNSTGTGGSSIVNGDFADGLTGWTQWTERGTISFGTSSEEATLAGNNVNGGIYQQFSTGGIGTEIDITGWWETNPTTANNQWVEVLIINGDRLPSNGSDINSGQSDVEMIYKNDTWTSTSGWSGDMDQTAAVTNVGYFTADDTVATIVLKIGNGGGSTNGAHFDDVVVSEAPAPVPTISLSTSSISASSVEGTSPVSDSFTVTNSGDGTLNYTVTDNASWLSVSPTSGASTGEADTIAVNYSTTALSAGSYSATITVDDDAASNGPVTISVALTVTAAPPVIGLSESTMTAQCDLGSNASSDSFTVQNDGGGTLSYTISDNATWMSCSPTSGTSTGEADTITVTYAASSLSAGTYNGTITVTDTNAGNSPQTIAVTLTVVNTSTVDFSTLPTWDDSFDAGWGSAATWASVSGGQSGNALEGKRTSQGSSVKTLEYDVNINTDYTISIYIKCPSSSTTYWIETACKLGSQTANNFDDSSSTWTMIKKFSNSGTNGNSSTWTQYSVNVNSGTNNKITIGFKHGASGGNGPTVLWDTLLID